jgi:hypothetical protein
MPMARDKSHGRVIKLRKGFVHKVAISIAEPKAFFLLFAQVYLRESTPPRRNAKDVQLGLLLEDIL